MTLEEYYNRPHDFNYYYELIIHDDIEAEYWEDFLFSDLEDYEIILLVILARKRYFKC